MDTIYAVATARGKAGLAVIRLSGPKACDVLAEFGVRLPEPRTAGLRRLVDCNGVLLDDALVIWFKSGASFTGELVVELHCHGSPATVSAILRALSVIDGLRLAEPGEFTRRALENGRLDLAQVEGLSDLIEAETEAQRRQALRVLTGAVGKKAEAWRADLIRAAALLEATIDFADEDVQVDVTPEVNALLDRVETDLQQEASGVFAAERIRDGFEIAIVGPPNSGKSTLLNALAGREAAITSEIEGTTRDVIEVRMDLAGLPVTILDTAGLRKSDDIIENIGINRGIQRAVGADLRVFLLDGDHGGDTVPGLEPMADDIVIQGKADLRPALSPSVSGLTGQGIGTLIDAMTERLELRAAAAGTITRERHRLAVERALGAIAQARNQLLGGTGRTEFAAEDLRSTIRALDSLVGRVDVENILDEIFASFCLGK